MHSTNRGLSQAQRVDCHPLSTFILALLLSCAFAGAAEKWVVPPMAPETPELAALRAQVKAGVEAHLGEPVPFSTVPEDGMDPAACSRLFAKAETGRAQWLLLAASLQLTRQWLPSTEEKRVRSALLISARAGTSAASVLKDPELGALIARAWVMPDVHRIPWAPWQSDDADAVISLAVNTYTTTGDNRLIISGFERYLGLVEPKSATADCIRLRLAQYHDRLGEYAKALAYLDAINPEGAIRSTAPLRTAIAAKLTTP